MTEWGKNGMADDNTSMKFVLSQCVDFKKQKCALAELIENRGHCCEFLPKYHPELSPIERCWAVAKRYFRSRCNYSYAGMLPKVLRSLLDLQIQPLTMIRRFFRKSRDYMRAYNQGLSSPQEIQLQLKVYKSHRLPPAAESSNQKKFKPYEKKKAIRQNLLIRAFDSVFAENAPQVTNSGGSDLGTTAIVNLDAIAQELVENLRIVDEFEDDSDFAFVTI